MNVHDLVGRLVEIRIKRNELAVEESQLMSQLSNGGGHTQEAKKNRVGRPQGSRAKFSYYTRMKLGKLRKKQWAEMSHAQRKERILKMQAGRKVKK